MSVKAMSLVWDYPCPSMIGEMWFRGRHKYTLLAYADHADHEGRSIYPAVTTVAKKMGVDERTVQRLTRDLELMGMLMPDGVGPLGTNRWRMPFSKGGDKLTPRQIAAGGKDGPSLGDNPSGDNLPPESTGTEVTDIEKEKKIAHLQTVASTLMEYREWARMKKRLEEDDITIVHSETSIVINGLTRKSGQFTEAEVWEGKYKRSFDRALIPEGLEIMFQ